MIISPSFVFHVIMRLFSPMNSADKQGGGGEVLRLLTIFCCNSVSGVRGGLPATGDMALSVQFL